MKVRMTREAHETWKNEIQLKKEVDGRHGHSIFKPQEKSYKH